MDIFFPLHEVYCLSLIDGIGHCRKLIEDRRRVLAPPDIIWGTAVVASILMTRSMCALKELFLPIGRMGLVLHFIADDLEKGVPDLIRVGISLDFSAVPRLPRVIKVGRKQVAHFEPQSLDDFLRFTSSVAMEECLPVLSFLN
jgi:hypothetical protein